MAVQSFFTLAYPCGVTIALPPQSPLGIFLPPKCQPSPNKWPANFVCQDCGRLFSHSAQDVHLVENASLVQSLVGESFWYLEFTCDQKGCKHCISTYIVWPESSSANGAAAFVRASNGLKCPQHGLILRPGGPTFVQKHPYLFRDSQ